MQKWWWAIYLWGMGVMLVNSYVCYKTYQESIGTDKKKILSQFEFRRSIALAWLKHDTYWPTMDKIAANNEPANNKKRKSQRDETPYLHVRAAAVSKNLLNA